MSQKFMLIVTVLVGFLTPPVLAQDQGDPTLADMETAKTVAESFGTSASRLKSTLLTPQATSLPTATKTLFFLQRLEHQSYALANGVRHATQNYGGVLFQSLKTRACNDVRTLIATAAASRRVCLEELGPQTETESFMEISRDLMDLKTILRCN